MGCSPHGCGGGQRGCGGRRREGCAFIRLDSGKRNPSILKAGPMEVVLVNGRRVRVPQGFVAEDLVRVLEVVEGGVSC